MLQELTGVIPNEIPLAPGEPLPQIRRRVGTAFALSPKILNRDKTTEVLYLMKKYHFIKKMHKDKCVATDIF